MKHKFITLRISDHGTSKLLPGPHIPATAVSIRSSQITTLLDFYNDYGKFLYCRVTLRDGTSINVQDTREQLIQWMRRVEAGESI